MKYEAPEMQVIGISAKDVIMTSGGGITGGEGDGNTGGGGQIED